MRRYRRNCVHGRDSSFRPMIQMIKPIRVRHNMSFRQDIN